MKRSPVRVRLMLVRFPTRDPLSGNAYLTEISAVVGTETITTKATYDYYRGWVTSRQEPKGVDAGSGCDYLYTYDLLGRITKKEFPLLAVFFPNYRAQIAWQKGSHPLEPQIDTAVDS